MFHLLKKMGGLFSLSISIWHLNMGCEALRLNLKSSLRREGMESMEEFPSTEGGLRER